MKEQYNTLEWNIRRLEILLLDNFTCVKCKSKTNLQVHHKKYDNSLKVWEYPDEYLVTVCNKCHEDFHSKTPITKMYEKIKKYKLDKDKIKMFQLKSFKIPKGVVYIPNVEIKREL